jgi:hypothetical protein
MSIPRLRDGWYVLVIAAVMLGGLLVWALAPAILRMTERPPGDGQTPSSYGFSLDNLRLPDSAPLHAALLHRDMVPVLDAPPLLIDAEEASAEVPRKGPFLVTKDLVIGVERNGEARAYPLLLLNVHEAMHDTFHGPLLITWHWPSGVTAVYDPTLDGVERTFGISGLVAAGGQLLYPRNIDGSMGGEPLIPQYTGTSISGPAMTLNAIPHVVTTWGQWSAQHPDTTVAAGAPAMKRRYADGKPDTYFHSSRLLFDVPVPENGPSAKSPAVELIVDGHSTLVTVDDLARHDGELQLRLGEASVTLTLIDDGRRIDVNAPPSVLVRRGLWHLVRGLHDPAATGPPSQVKR